MTDKSVGILPEYFFQKSFVMNSYNSEVVVLLMVYKVRLFLSKKEYVRTTQNLDTTLQCL